MNVAALVYSLRELYRKVRVQIEALDEGAKHLPGEEWPSTLWQSTWSSAVHSLVHADRVLHERELQVLDLVTERSNEEAVLETAETYRAKYAYFTTELWHAHAVRRFGETFQRFLMHVEAAHPPGQADVQLAVEVAVLLMTTCSLLSIVDGDLHIKEHSLVLRLDGVVIETFDATDAFTAAVHPYNTSMEEWRQRLDFEDDLKSYEHTALTDESAEIYAIQKALGELIAAPGDP